MDAATIRPGGNDDIDAVLALWAAADAEPTVTDDADSIRCLIRHDPDALLVAEQDGRLVGTLIATWDGWRAAMWRLAIHPDHRRLGIASRLVRWAEDRFLRLGARRIALFVDTADPSPGEFWVACGYEPQSHRRRLVKNLVGP